MAEERAKDVQTLARLMVQNMDYEEALDYAEGFLANYWPKRHLRLIPGARYTAQFYDNEGTLLGVFPVHQNVVSGDRIQWTFEVST